MEFAESIGCVVPFAAQTTPVLPVVHCHHVRFDAPRDDCALHFRKGIGEVDPDMVLDTLRNAAFSAFLVGQQAALHMRENSPPTPL